ncbi:hypothetical protein RB195_014788 [Necator americanus]|uniref:Uncharacterized protein n=1 Tax=Necator americanus TaxID=51031 RepID=A0ABR1E240_NECAM
MNAVAGILINAKLVDPASLQQVPVLKFRNRDGIMVDLQFNNVGTIRSSLFVRTCVQDAEMLVISDNHKCYKISPAEVIIKMIDYYSQLDLNNISIDICGKTYKRIADNAEDTFIQLIDPYFPEDTSPHARCTVRNGPSLVQQAFTALRSELLAGKKSKFFRSTT